MARYLAAIVLTLALALGLTDVSGQEPLPEAPAGAQLSSYSPANPYGELAVGILVRQISDQTVDGLRVLIIDLLVGPGISADPVGLIGQSTHLVLSGAGVMTFGTPTGPVTRPFVAGSSFQFGPGDPFQITSTGAIPVDIRVRIVTVATGGPPN